ncbi:hypothetical protein Tco_0001406 [Tanacetum coccineum]
MEKLSSLLARLDIESSRARKVPRMIGDVLDLHIKTYVHHVLGNLCSTIAGLHTGPEGPPSPDYIPGPEELEQAPPSPIYIPFVPEPVYPEFLLVDDEIFPAEEQPMPAADSPTHQSPGYIPESDPEEDPEEG